MERKRSRRKFTSAFKVKVGIEALKERARLSELAKRFDLHPNRASQEPKFKSRKIEPKPKLSD